MDHQFQLRSHFFLRHSFQGDCRLGFDAVSIFSQQTFHSEGGGIVQDCFRMLGFVLFPSLIDIENNASHQGYSQQADKK